MSEKRQTKFGSWVRSRGRAKGLETDKEIAGRLHDALEARGIVIQVGTATSKFSKLCRGHPEGRQLIATDGHLEALAEVLGETFETVVAALRESDEHRVLILHPSLPAEVRRDILARADEPTALFEARSPDQTDLTHLVAAAREVGPRAVIVLSKEADREKLSVAGVDACTVGRTRRGFASLSGAFAVLLPEPPPPPPPTMDAKLGPLFPFSPDSKWAGQVPRSPVSYDHGYGDPRWQVDARAAIDRGDWFGVPVAEALEWVVEDRLGKPLRSLGIHPGRPREDDILKWLVDGECAHAHVWFAGHRLVGMGPSIEVLTELFAPHHPELGVHPVVIPPDVAVAFSRRNLRRARQAPWWTAASAGFVNALAVSLADTPAVLAARREAPIQSGTVRCASDADLVSAREVIDELGARQFTIDARYGWGPATGSTIPLRLARLAEAPLLSLPRTDADALHVIGDIGAGWLLQLRVQRFPDEPALPDMTFLDGAWDGGDVRMWLDAFHDQVLEGSKNPAEARRIDAAAAATAAAAYDDDDD